VTDLVLVNLKGPDYTSHMHGPDSPELAATLAELDRQLAAYLSLIEQKAGQGRSVVVITADHGMAPEPRPGRRFMTGDIIAAIHQRFDPEGRMVQYYGDPTNLQLHLDTARLTALGHSLREVADYLEGLGMFAAAFTEDEVRAAMARLR
jgi:membrane-anchored protein YejM (alkaline phosphatase superfamily)